MWLPNSKDDNDHQNAVTTPKLEEKSLGEGRKKEQKEKINEKWEGRCNIPF